MIAARATLLVAALGCASPADGARAEIVGGAPDDAHPAVVAVINWDRAAGGGLCTGTLIARDVVLTAKHCVWHRDGSAHAETAFDRLEVRVGPHAVSDIVETIGVVEVSSTPGAYTVARIREGDDLALLRLARPLDGVTPLAVATSLPAAGARATIVGYGFIDATAPDVGRRHAGSTEVVEVGTHLARTLGESWTCQGDSGGPLLAEGRVAAVTSAGMGGCVRDASHLYTLVAPHLALVERVAPPACVPSTETCDGTDEDCDGVVDEHACDADGGAPREPGDGGTSSADAGAAPSSAGCASAPARRSPWSLVLGACALLRRPRSTPRRSAPSRRSGHGP
ncbi:MAG: trypsin-like serine protease [Sandaracinaceae bacterium]|nr:trypsin-like serine protease [Sandaracinaceae bacterium]